MGFCERASYFTVACSNCHTLDHEILQKYILEIIFIGTNNITVGSRGEGASLLL